MTLDVNDWFRSLTVLGIAFVAVIAVTIGLATLIVPNPTVSSEPSDGPPPPPSGVAVPYVPGRIGGSIAVTGDVEAAFIVERESFDGRYALTGDDGRIFFGEEPLSIEQVSFDGLEFFLDPGDCSITPGTRDDETGVADAHVRCEAIEDVRGQGVVTLDGTVGIASDLVGLRGDLPPEGGTVTFGDRTLEFTDASMLHPRFASVVGQMIDADMTSLLVVTYDAISHSLELAEVSIDGAVSTLPPDACALSTTEVGIVNPHARLVELTIACEAVEIEGLGTVDVAGSLMVVEVEQL
jgi:hypothetical protein